MRTRLHVSIVVLAALLAARVQGQGPSANFDELPADEFVVAAKLLMRSFPSPTPQRTQEVVETAWTRFLGDETFVANSDWQTLADLASIVGIETKWLDASTAGEQSQRVTNFVARLDARLELQPIAELPAESLSAVDAVLEAAGLPPGNLAPRVAQWMQEHPWQNASLPVRIRLANLLHVERIPAERFSVRWSGSLTPAAEGQYVFEQLQQHHIDGSIRVTLGGQVILDSARDSKPAGDGSERLKVQSDAVSLTASEPIPLVVEYQYDAASMVRNDEFAERIFPMAVLLWKRGDGPTEIVPPAVFTTPEGGPGLQGEYFGNLGFNEPILTRVDPGLQMIWSERQIVSDYSQQQSLLTQSCLEDIRESGFGDDPAFGAFVEIELPKLLKRLPALDRAAVVEVLAADAEHLPSVSCYGMRRVLQHAFMLPPNLTADFCVAWVEKRDVDVGKILPYPGWGPGTYMSYAYDDYGWVGHFMRGANWPIAQLLLDESLENEDGSCNLMVAYCVSQAAMHDQRAYEVKSLIDAKLAEETLQGNNRATWLVGRAFLEEINSAPVPLPLLGMPYLSEALLVAESDELGFRIFQEMVARTASAESLNAATKLLNSLSDRFQAPEQAAAQALWRTQAAALVEVYAQQRAIEAALRQQDYVNELQRRRQLAIEIGDTASADQFDQMLQDSQ